jgi:hypothetical protein
MPIAMKCPKQAYERDPEVLHLYVKDIRILTLNWVFLPNARKGKISNEFYKTKIVKTTGKQFSFIS